MSKITILGKYLELNMMDSDDAKRVHEAMLAFASRWEKIGQTEQAYHEMLLSLCLATREMFNDIFGSGTDQKLFGNRNNLELCAQAFGQLAEEITKKQPKRAREIFAKYLPARQKDEP